MSDFISTGPAVAGSGNKGPVVLEVRNLSVDFGVDKAWVPAAVGLDYEVRAGEVLALVQAYAEPCATNAQWFLDGDFMLMGKHRGPVSRVYATVLEPGRITTGDAFVLEPAS